MAVASYGLIADAVVGSPSLQASTAPIEASNGANIGTKAVEGDHYQGTRAIKFYLPSRGQQYAAQKAGRLKWVMAAELTETTRIYARTVARIEHVLVSPLREIICMHFIGLSLSNRIRTARRPPTG